MFYGLLLTISLRLIMARLERDRPSIKPSDKFSGREVLRAICSPHVIIVSILFFMVGTTIFGLALFLPSIVSELGFSRNKTQLLSVGPYALGFFGVYLRRTHPQNSTPTVFFFVNSYTNISIPIRPLPIERYCDSVDCLPGSCGIFDFLW